jgi:hypothetical protein
MRLESETLPPGLAACDGSRSLFAERCERQLFPVLIMKAGAPRPTDLNFINRVFGKFAGPGQGPQETDDLATLAKLVTDIRHGKKHFIYVDTESPPGDRVTIEWFPLPSCRTSDVEP